MEKNDLIIRRQALDALIAEGRNVDTRYLESERIIHEADAERKDIPKLKLASLYGKCVSYGEE